MSFWTWMFGDVVYTKKEIDDLIDQIKKFDAGAVDEYLSNHVDNVYAQWINNHKEKS